MKKLLDYLAQRWKYEVKTIKFYLIIVSHSILLGVILLLAHFKGYNFALRQQRVDAFIIAFVIVFLVNLFSVVAKNSFLKNAFKSKNKYSYNKKSKLNQNDAKIAEFLRNEQEKETNHTYKSFYAFWIVGFVSALGILISYLSY
ncbi:hypothetical protein NPA08_02685 [Mycoplasmopsis citelli]|uniref:DUF3899 domain-containing protein n=1 Tax=Mycoplasmopsis citelli TaxID=171281 RepID=A0A449B1H1_9BACT|nr:hypothetical protein [Mycoplasmopsis citelli]UUD35852.1 hypothetical protein NPA08_02685 [Mycoplasmopsis citelli]VEU74385.1 Uncharacterised protein [Mycoplasmopsis citelli]